jgi:hypothetical protein
MVRAILFPLVVGGLIAAHVAVSLELQSIRHGLIRQAEVMAPLPAPALKLMALDYRNLVADWLFSRTLSFHGGQLAQKEPIDDDTYRIIYRRLDVASELDPYFVDPYFFGQAVLTWGAGMPQEANRLLDRGRRYRPDDWIIPFFMGFNAFYFLHDNAQAATYLMEASRHPGSPPFAALLAVRLASQSGGTDTSIAFLQQLAAQTEDPATRRQIQRRLEALKGIWLLEQAVERYRARFGSAPSTISDLVERGILTRLPTDPYGGSFYLDSNGKVWTTSDLRSVRR